MGSHGGLAVLDNTSIRSSVLTLSDELCDIFLAASHIVRFPKGRMVIGEGIEPGSVFLVVDGTVQVSLTTQSGRATIIRDIGKGQIFGELSAIDGMTRSADVHTVNACELAVMTATRFTDLISSSAPLAVWLSQHLTRQIRFLTSRIFELSNMSVASRLICELVRLSFDAGIEGDRAVINHAPTHAELGARVGTNRESVTREMSYLAGKGIVSQYRRQLTVNAVSALLEEIRW